MSKLAPAALLLCVVTHLLCVGICLSSEVHVSKSQKGWELLVDGQPYLVKGVCYWPVKVGESPDDASWRDWTIVDDDHDGRIDVAYQSWVDKNGNNRQDPDEPEVGDFRLLREMGCNTIRLYHHASTNPAVQVLYSDSGQQAMFNHAPNKALLRDLFKTYGIRVAMGDFLGAYTAVSGATWEVGTDYRDPQQRKRMMLSIEDMVREFKDEPYILMWIIGNENRNRQATHTNAAQYPKDFAEFVNQVAHRIHDLDPHHPVCLCDWDPLSGLKNYVSSMPDVDIFGVNSYRFFGFGTLWKEIAYAFDKPVLITEYGVSYPKIVNGQVDEDHHAGIIRAGWEDIVAHAAGGSKAPATAIGGFVYEWLDQWWQDGDPWHQNLSTNWNHEICGVASQGNGEHSPLLRHLRKTYFTLQALWTRKETYVVQ